MPAATWVSPAHVKTPISILALICVVACSPKNQSQLEAGGARRTQLPGARLTNNTEQPWLLPNPQDSEVGFETALGPLCLRTFLFSFVPRPFLKTEPSLNAD